eukprot:11169795-Lingulodinium_polyedra.AAC.1
MEGPGPPHGSAASGHMATFADTPDSAAEGEDEYNREYDERLTAILVYMHDAVEQLEQWAGRIARRAIATDSLAGAAQRPSAIAA